MRVLLHIGFPKTATTLFQKHVFPNHPDLAFFGKYNSPLTSEIITARLCDYDAAAMRQQLLRQAAEQGKGSIIISRERISGNPLLSAQEGDQLAHRLSLTFPEAETIMFVRNQAEMIESLFVDMVVGGGSGTCTNLRKLLRTNEFKHGKIGWNPEYLMYDKLIGYYDKLFGADRVNVFVFEEFRSDFGSFISMFFDRLNLQAIDVPRHVMRGRSGSWRYHFLRTLNRYRRGQLNPGRTGLPPRADRMVSRLGHRIDNLQNMMGLSAPARCLDADLVAEIENTYRESNRRLAARLQKPLSEYGYAV